MNDYSKVTEYKVNKKTKITFPFANNLKFKTQ